MITEQQVLDQLSKVYDPEIPINIVEVGLVYGVKIEGSKVEAKLTMTAPGCPAVEQIVADAQMRIKEIPGVTDVAIDVVWDPPWTPDRLSEAAKLELGFTY